MRIYPIWEIVHDGPYQSLVDALLAGRSLSREDLAVGPDRLHPPHLLTDLEAGVERIERAVRQGQKIVVFGDYDVDGVTSTALLLDFLQQVDASCDYILPDRYRDGYGIKPAGLRRALDKGAELIVTVDNGIAAFEALELAKSEGIDVVVVDHHRQLGDLPPAHSIVNPNRRDCPYPFKGLAGVGLTFKVVQALSQAFMEGAARRRYLNQLLDLVALGTVADVAPVMGENRVLVQHGLKMLERTGRPGLRQLKSKAGYADKPLNTTAVGFYLGPRINVAGRLETPDIALKLLRAQHDDEAAHLADQLNQLNARRQRLQRQGLKEALHLVDPEDLERDRIIIVLGESWHLGVIGLLASKLVDQYARPAVVCTDDRGDGTYTGSARSIPGYDISTGIDACGQYLTHFGGHAGAGGFSLEADQYEAFRLAFIEHANAHIADRDMQAKLEVDLILQAGDVAAATLKELEALEPFGQGNAVPVFGLRGCRVLERGRIGREGAHLKLSLKVGERALSALWWNQGAKVEEVEPGQEVSAAFVLEEDSYAGNGAVQMVLRDLCETI